MQKLLKCISYRPVNLFCIAAALFLYVINKTVLQAIAPGFLGYFCRCYLNDLVCPLFFLACSNLLLILAGQELTHFRSIFLLGASAGLMWEIVGPLINPRSVADFWDFLCYLCGTVIYYGILRMALRK